MYQPILLDTDIHKDPNAVMFVTIPGIVIPCFRSSIVFTVSSNRNSSIWLRGSTPRLLQLLQDIVDRKLTHLLRNIFLLNDLFRSSPGLSGQQPNSSNPKPSTPPHDSSPGAPHYCQADTSLGIRRKPAHCSSSWDPSNLLFSIHRDCKGTIFNR